MEMVLEPVLRSTEGRCSDDRIDLDGWTDAEEGSGGDELCRKVGE